MYDKVRSGDGTTIGYEISGEGPVLVAVHGGTADRTRWDAQRPLLGAHFTLWAVDRRGRGLSGDRSSYCLEREADDLAAVVEAAGPEAFVLAHSYGATVALAAARELHGLGGLVLYEPAVETPGHVIVDEETFAQVEALLDEDAREEALTLFFRRVIGLPHHMIEAMRSTPVWAARLAAVHTLTREGRAAQAFCLDREALGALPFPVLVLRGTQSPEWLQAAAASTHDAIPGSRLVDLDGQAHMAMDTAPETFAREVTSFLQRSRATLA